MALTKYAYGIAGVKYGTPTGTSSMPGTLTPWAQTVQGSFTLSESESTTKDFFVEETSTPVESIVSEAGALSITWRAYDLTPALIVIMKGGTAGVQGTGSTQMQSYAGPVTIDKVNLALEVTTTSGAIFHFYKASCLCRFDSAISREQMLEVEVTATMQDPGDGKSPYYFELPDPH
ncbi:MAG: hypothetical protein M0Q91_11975 [Methanoregula sp.]|jgi:hypothetical protein|nr:hypothetical protein [Methanoregula sp.]